MGRPPVETIGVVAERPSQSETKRNATANAEASTRRSGQTTTQIAVIGLLSTALSLTSKLDKVNIRPTFVLILKTHRYGTRNRSIA